MKKTLSLLWVFFAINLIAENQIISVFNEILFYDGYASTVDEPVPEDIIRHSNAVYGKKLTSEQLSLFGDQITMEVIVKAACDNYDRLGHVHLSLVQKGAETYSISEVERIELARFITPFMNKNLLPDTVPYLFDISYLKHIFKEKTLLEKYDFWIELEIFGVPYAAQTQVSGCGDRIDVFYGTLNFITSSLPIEEQEGNVLIPLFNKEAFNNYQENATDEISKTVKTIEFTLDRNMPNSAFVLITSNHGANAGGEEYNRRWHYVYFNDVEILNYKPGRYSCEEFRKYNTQANGIYGYSPRTDKEWQSFSNWCPGDIIDTRIIHLGEVKAGTHTFKIEVPNAVFVDNEGNFPLSLYFLSTVTPTSSVYNNIEYNEFISIYPNPADNILYIDAAAEIKLIYIYDNTGKKVLEKNHSTAIDISLLSSGIYWIYCIDENSKEYTEKFIKN